MIAVKGRHILLLTLKTFSATGGIEKVCRVLAKALQETLQPGIGLQLISMHDSTADAAGNAYLPTRSFSGYKGNKLLFVWAALKAAQPRQTIILSHINLLPVGWLIKRCYPSVHLLLWCHGIEVWRPITGLKKMMLKKVDQFVCVSRFTRDKMSALHGIEPGKLQVLNNCLDPFLATPVKSADNLFKEKYNGGSTDFVMLMLSRIAITERHKHYETVIKALPVAMKNAGRQISYLIAGKYTPDEAAHIRQVAVSAGVADNIKMIGFVPDASLPELFAAADLYIMPSSKEGFGIVFIEAMYYGLPVIAGNADGSTDALADGELGLLVDPDDEQAIIDAIGKVMNEPARFIPDRDLLLEKFGFENYKHKLGDLLFNNAEQG